VVEGRGAAGWQHTCNAETFLADLRAYDALLCQYPNVLGATVFTMGQYASQWQPFDVGPIWPAVVAEQEVCVQDVQPVATIRTPIAGARISQQFGEHPEWYPKYQGHPGIDLAAPDSDWRAWHGTPVRATIDGTALTVTDASGYGLYVYVTGSECDELLAHLSGFAVANGAEVHAGDVVGYVGYTGQCKPIGGAGSHLHWGKRPRPIALSNGYRGYVDPMA
jgi:murein DD-endopeptidase MepM/ murein hydrolase activator NlpD